MSESSFEKACLPARRDLIAFATKLCYGDRARAEDVVQDSLLRAYLAWDRFVFQGESSGRGWLYRIVANQFANEYHKLKREKEVIAENAADICATNYNDPSIEGSCDDYSDEVVRALMAIEPWQREILHRCCVLEQPYDEAAIKTGVPRGTAASRLWRAKRDAGAELASWAQSEYGIAPAQCDE